MLEEQVQRLADRVTAAQTARNRAASGRTSPTKAQIDDYARRNGFPRSDFPYFQRPDRCGAGRFSDIIPDGWYHIDFGEACNAHDRCYMTPGSDRKQCDQAFFENLKAAVRRDLSQRTARIPVLLSPFPSKVVTTGFKGKYKPSPSDLAVFKLSEVAGLVPPVPLPPGTILPRGVDPIEPTSLMRGLAVAKIYHAVVDREGGKYHREAQAMARKYKALTDAYIYHYESAGTFALAVVQHSNELFEAFSISGSGDLWHVWQRPTGWSDWHNLGHPTDLNPATLAMARNAQGLYDAFALGEDGHLWHIGMRTDPWGWSAWSDLGRPPVEASLGPALAVVQHSNELFEAFSISGSGDLWHVWQRPTGWSDWHNLGHPTDLNPATLAMARNAQGLYDAFALGEDGHLWHIGMRTDPWGWSAWSDLGRPPVEASLGPALAVVQHSNGSSRHSRSLARVTCGMSGNGRPVGATGTTSATPPTSTRRHWPWRETPKDSMTPSPSVKTVTSGTSA